MEDDDQDSEESLESMDGVNLVNGNDREGDDDNDDDDEEGEGIDIGSLQPVDSDEDEDEKESSAEDVMEDVEVPKVEGLSTGGFDWTGGLPEEEEPEPQSETDGETPQPKKKKRRKAEIKIDRTGDLDANGPQSVADFERLLMGQPNSSYLWLSYMAFELQLSEVTKAREIAERAIRTINIREEAEKMNVWVALLNLENTYGTDELVEEVFKRACQYNDAQEIHERLTSIYIQSGKDEVRRSPNRPLSPPNI